MSTRSITMLAGQATLVGSWRALAQLSPDAMLVHTDATVAAVFPSWAPLNNAILRDEPNRQTAAAAARQLTELYRPAGIESWALWLPSPATSLDEPLHVTDVDGMKRDTTTLVMRLQLPRPFPKHDGVIRTSVTAATRASDEPVPGDELTEPDASSHVDAWVMMSGEFAVAGAWSYLHGSDCGIYAVGTAPEWRRRGLARALMQHVLADAQRRGARSATLPSTAMGQPLYTSLGFTAMGQYEEWVPA
jgi:ribosomal protein S18 acetylase RimI-like enzyme